MAPYSKAAATYLRHLRELRGYSRAFLVPLLRTTENTLWRIEDGRQDPGTELLISILSVLGGRFTDLYQLAANEERTVEEAQRLAEAAVLRGPGTVDIFGGMMQATVKDILALTNIGPLSRLGDRVYEGVRHINDAYSATVTVNGRPFKDVFNEEGNSGNRVLEWGYAGAGPALLAETILEYEYGLEIARMLASKFLFDVVANLPRGQGEVEWVMNVEQIRLWVKIVVMTEYVSKIGVRAPDSA